MLAGSLTEFALDDVFMLLANTRKSGVLNLESGEAKGRVWISNGGLAYAVADVTRSPLSARLLHLGEVSGNQATEIIAAQASGDLTAVPDTLAAVGVESDRVAEVLREQITDAIFDLGEWDDGEFTFDVIEHSGGIPSVKPTAIREDVEGRIVEWLEIEEELPPFDAVLTSVPHPRGDGSPITLDGAQWAVMTIIDSLRSINEIIALTGLGRFRTCQILRELLEDGLVEAREEPNGETPSQERSRILTSTEEMLLGAPPAKPRPEIDIEALRGRLSAGSLTAPVEPGALAVPSPSAGDGAESPAGGASTSETATEVTATPQASTDTESTSTVSASGSDGSDVDADHDADDDADDEAGALDASSNNDGEGETDGSDDDADGSDDVDQPVDVDEPDDSDGSGDADVSDDVDADGADESEDADEAEDAEESDGPEDQHESDDLPAGGPAFSATETARIPGPAPLPSQPVFVDDERTEGAADSSGSAEDGEEGGDALGGLAALLKRHRGKGDEGNGSQVSSG